MSEAPVYLTQIKRMSDTLALVAAAVPAELLYRRPGPHLNPVGWIYWHLLRTWDMDLNWTCRGQKPGEDAWHRGGFTEKAGYDPDGKGGFGLGVGYGYSDAEVDGVKIGADVLGQYHDMLMAETEEYLGNASDGEMRRPTPSVTRPSELRSVAERIQHIIAHSYTTTGEMRYAMGVLGMRDPSYPEQSEQSAGERRCKEDQ